MATKKTAVKKTAVKKVSAPAAAKSACKKSCVKKVVAKPVEKKVAEKVIEENNNSYIIIDYPCENETVAGGYGYVVKIGASFDGAVEISFNDGEWLPCRFASGYWWFDWNNYNPGIYKIVARLVGNGGKILKVSDVRKCKVN